MSLRIAAAIWTCCFASVVSTESDQLKIVASTEYDAQFLQQVRGEENNIGVDAVGLNTEDYLDYLTTGKLNVDVFTVDIIYASVFHDTAYTFDNETIQNYFPSIHRGWNHRGVGICDQ